KIFAITNYLKVLGPIRVMEVAFNLCLYILALFGIVNSWMNRNHVLLTVTLLPTIYFTAIPVLSRAGSGMDTRARTPFTFSLAILAAQSLYWLWKRYIKKTEIS
ncbi:MAG: hypothetical protein VX199_00260, partial [Chloroflexota bacterium]|nr:hypothetical protein [Chloroflexota bacterium]